jgi:hypothetical protein
MALFMHPKEIPAGYVIGLELPMAEPEVTFRNMSSGGWLEEDIQRRVRKLNVYCPDIISSRALVEIPHRHQRSGKRFHVRIDLTVPGEHIVVSHGPTLRGLLRDLGRTAWAKQAEIESARKDIHLVVREAFDIARRQLCDYARRRRLAVKTHKPRSRRPAPQAASAAR